MILYTNNKQYIGYLNDILVVMSRKEHAKIVQDSNYEGGIKVKKYEDAPNNIKKLFK